MLAFPVMLARSARDETRKPDFDIPTPRNQPRYLGRYVIACSTEDIFVRRPSEKTVKSRDSIFLLEIHITSFRQPAKEHAHRGTIRAIGSFLSCQFQDESPKRRRVLQGSAGLSLYFRLTSTGETHGRLSVFIPTLC